jgi:hypothetical protein
MFFMLDLCVLFSFVCIVIRRLECTVVFVVGALDHNYVKVVVFWSNYCFYFDAGQLAISQYPEGPATGHLDTGFSRFPSVYKRMLRRFPPYQVASTCFSCSPPDLTLILLMWKIGRAPNNASKWQMGFNSVFKGLNSVVSNCLLSYYVK